MDGSLDQLMRLLSNRGLEWLRQRIMALPDPMPPDHPDLAALAMIAQAAPVLSGLRGRASPLEVIVARRLTPDLVRAVAMAVLAGARGPGPVGLMLAGGLVARDDPLWHLACEDLAEDDTLPLPHRLILGNDPDLLARAERVVTTLPRRITPGHVTLVAQVLAQLYRHGAQRPVLSDARAFTRIFAHLTRLAEWAQGSGCTASVAQIAFCLRLLDPDHAVTDMVGDLIAVQRPDGSFPARLGFGRDDQTLSQGVHPTVQVAMALHMAAWGRWRGPAPVWLRPRPLHHAAQLMAARVAKAPLDPDQRLRAAALLTRATGRAWLARLDAPRRADPAQLADLARICFRDPTLAQHLRGWLGLCRNPRTAPGLAGPEAAWLSGTTVRLTPAPPALTALWDRAAKAGYDATFLTCARMALHHADTRTTTAVRHRTRLLAARMLTDTDADPARLLDRLDALTLLAHLIEPPDRAVAAA